jgi:hypothetical protein
MNAKEQIIKELNALRLGYNRERILYVNSGLGENSLQIILCDKSIERITNLITATEQAIFDVPSQEEISNISNDFKVGIGITASKCFEKGINFILTYNKPEHDGSI